MNILSGVYEQTEGSRNETGDIVDFGSGKTGTGGEPCSAVLGRRTGTSDQKK
jgi:hypothetical protein